MLKGRRPPTRLFALAAPLLLAGVFSLDERAAERWGWSGAWLYPVGDPYQLRVPATDGTAAYHAGRGIAPGGNGVPAHQGVDLMNGAPRGPVRAAAGGLVVRAGRHAWQEGYGWHVVIAHRLPDGTPVYTVYAHLAARSVMVHEGDCVGAGETLARVGISGRATTPHLHFEVRRPADPSQRWEKAEFLDPIAFIAARLPTRRADSTWARPYLEWAECASLVAGTPPGEAPLTRAAWWQMLARSVRHGLDEVPEEAGALRDRLVEAGVLPEHAGSPAGLLSWGELARDLERAGAPGLRLRPCPVASGSLGADCREHLGAAFPADDPGLLARRSGPAPTLAEACLALADLAAPRRAASPAPRD